MRFSLRSVRVLSVAALVVAPVLSTRDAFGGSSSAVVPLACTSTFGSNTGHITLDASVPDNVAPGSAFAFDVTARDFFDIPAPYSGTLSLQLTFAASSGATPSGNFVVSAPAVHFDQGDFIPVLGVFHEQFVASGRSGLDDHLLVRPVRLHDRPGPGSAVARLRVHADVNRTRHRADAGLDRMPRRDAHDRRHAW